MENNINLSKMISDIYNELVQNIKILENLKEIIEKNNTLNSHLMEDIISLGRSFKHECYIKYSKSDIYESIPKKIKNIIHDFHVEYINEIEKKLDELNKHFKLKNVHSEEKNIDKEYEDFRIFISHIHMILEVSIQIINSYYDKITVQ